MMINQGNVGIGVNDTKGYKLAVNGSLIATSVTVKLQASWPDYVFRPGYSLPKLKAVKNYVDAHQHLPGVPSAEEVSEKGLDVGEMNKLMMKKIEELTLYLIEKDNQVSRLTRQLHTQQRQITLIKRHLVKSKK